MKSLAEEKIELDALLQEVKSAKRLMDEAEKKCKETDVEIEYLRKTMSYFGGDEIAKLYSETGQIITQIQRSFERKQQDPANQDLKKEYLDLIKKKNQLISEKNAYYNPKLHPELCQIREKIEETKQEKITWEKIFSQRKEEYSEKDAVYQKKKSFGGQWHPDGINHGHITAIENEDDYDVSYRREPSCNVS